MNKEFYVKKCEENEAEITFLNRQVDYLLNELISLNAMRGVKPYWYTSEIDWSHCMAYKAGLAIMKLHDMKKQCINQK